MPLLRQYPVALHVGSDDGNFIRPASSSEAFEMTDHAPAHRGIGQPAQSGTHVLDHVIDP